MSSDEHWRKLERLYRGAPVNQYWEPRISIADRSCEIVIPIREDFFHPAGAAHGVTYFKALDDAAFFAANSVEEEFLLLTASFQVMFIRPISSGELRAQGTVVEATRTMVFAESVARDSAGREVGRGSGVFAVSRIRLGPDIGYS
ncbi:MAG TPA: PaaI family thioesterase [Thermoanaerobaculia bacterium]|nr:PaaI family thioesterase [Thermoanaerobaculia bacterium]